MLEPDGPLGLAGPENPNRKMSPRGAVGASRVYCLLFIVYCLGFRVDPKGAVDASRVCCLGFRV